MDWQRGEIPYFVLPPIVDEKDEEEQKKNEDIITLDNLNVEIVAKHKEEIVKQMIEKGMEVKEQQEEDDEIIDGDEAPELVIETKKKKECILFM